MSEEKTASAGPREQDRTQDTLRATFRKLPGDVVDQSRIAVREAMVRDLGASRRLMDPDEAMSFKAIKRSYESVRNGEYPDRKDKIHDSADASLIGLGEKMGYRDKSDKLDALMAVSRENAAQTTRQSNALRHRKEDALEM